MADYPSFWTEQDINNYLLLKAANPDFKAWWETNPEWGEGGSVVLVPEETIKTPTPTPTPTPVVTTGSGCLLALFGIFF